MENGNRSDFNFEKLLVYQKALNFIDFVYDMREKNFPKNEIFGLTSPPRSLKTLFVFLFDLLMNVLFVRPLQKEEIYN